MPHRLKTTKALSKESQKAFRGEKLSRDVKQSRNNNVEDAKRINARVILIEMLLLNCSQTALLSHSQVHSYGIYQQPSCVEMAAVKSQKFLQAMKRFSPSLR